MPIVDVVTKVGANAVVRVHERDELGLGERSPDLLHLRVVQALADALGAHHDATQPRQAFDLLDRLDDCLSRDARHKWQRAERVEALLGFGLVELRLARLLRRERGAVLVEVLVEL